MNISRSRMLLCIGLLPLIAVAASPQTTHEFTLDNGLKVVVPQDHRAPVVSSQLWVKVGSNHEHPGQSGLSHALEHMLFKGSSKACAGAYATTLERLGARENAFTGADFTTYHQTMTPGRLGVAFELMADIITTARLADDDFSTELEVIKEERSSRVDDDPQSLTHERLASIAYPASSYASPIIGWLHDLRRMSAAQLRAWYQAWYAPNNATLVVVGDVSVEQVKGLAQRYFGPIPRRDIPPVMTPLELAEPGERKITLQLSVHAPRLIMSFNVPSLTTAENRRLVYALRLLETLLAGSDSARIRKRLQYTEQLFSEVSSEYDAFKRGDSLFILSTELDLKQTITLTDAENRLWQLLDELKATPPEAAELERARTTLIANQVYAGDSIEHQAHTLGTLESIGLSWRLMEQEIEEFNQVTPQDIQHAASTYLTRQRLSVVNVLPEKNNG